MRKEGKIMMTNINETVESYFEGCVGVGVFDCFVCPSSLASKPKPPTEAIGKGAVQPPHVSKLVGTGDVSK